MVSATFQHDWTRRILERYVEWFLPQYAGYREVSALFARHCEFFRICDSRIAEELDMHSARMLQIFDVPGLKKYEIPIRFLHDYAGLVITPAEKLEQAKRRHIQAVLDRSLAQPWHDLLSQFHCYLIRRKSLQLRSVDTALLAAEKFFTTAGVATIADCTPGAIAEFLDAHPTYRASVSVFLKFAREILLVQIPMPAGAWIRSVPQRPRRVRVVAKVIDEIILRGVERTPLRVLQRALGLALRLPNDAFERGSWTLVERRRVHHLLHDQQEIRLTPALVPLAERWARMRAGASG